MKIIPLVGIELAAFALTIAEAYAFFTFVVPLGPFPHNLRDFTFFASVKVLLTFGLAVFWLGVMIALTETYVRSRLGRPTPTPSS